MKALADSRLVVVGLGLMGGSLAGALRGRCERVVGVSRRPETIEQALELGLIDEGTVDLPAALTHADVVVLATPVRTILRQLAEIGPLLPVGSLLIDLGSTKREICAAMDELPVGIQALGGHPMCGKEVAGTAAADPALYRGRTFIFCPLERTSSAALALGEELARAVGALPLVMDADRQDYLVATVSHLPYLLACSLVATADATTSADPLVWQIVAGGYRDTSRVAGSDVTMMMDILTTNRDRILSAVDVYQEQLAQLKQQLASHNDRGLQEGLEHIRATRKEMFP